MDSPPAFEESCRQLNQSIRLAFSAAERHDPNELLRHLVEIRRNVCEPELLDVALKNNQLSDLMQFFLSDARTDVREAALDIFLSGLDGLKDQELTRKEEETAKVVIRAIDMYMLIQAVRSDLFPKAFYGLSRWCGRGRRRRDLFLEAIPIEKLSSYCIYHFASDVLTSYSCLVGTILEQGRGRVPLFGPVVEIYQKVLARFDNTCLYAKLLSKWVRESLKEFESENSIEKVCASRFIDFAVRHAMSKETCRGKCHANIMELVAKCLAGCNNEWQRLVDQGILNLIDICVYDDRAHVQKYACSALAIVFAGSLENIDNALQKNLIGSLFALRDRLQERIDEEARNALLQFFARATPKQIFTLFEQDHCEAIVKLLDSADVSVQFDGLRWLFALVSATRTHAPHELPKLHQKMLELHVKQACERLIDHGVTTNRSLAQGLLNLMNTDWEKTL